MNEENSKGVDTAGDEMLITQENLVNDESS